MTVVNAQQLPNNWARWWSNINPAWRTRIDGRLVTGGEGDWSSMWKPTGTNGWINVLGCLQALRGVVGDEKWAAELHDVAWVLSEVLKAKQARG